VPLLPLLSLPEVEFNWCWTTLSPTISWLLIALLTVLPLESLVLMENGLMDLILLFFQPVLHAPNNPTALLLTNPPDVVANFSLVLIALVDILNKLVFAILVLLNLHA